MTTEITRPIGTILNEWSLTGGATAHEILSDDSPSSYMSTGIFEEVMTLLCDEPSPPAGSVMKQLRLRARAGGIFGTSILVHDTVASWNTRLYEKRSGVGVSSIATITLATMTPGISGSASPQVAFIYAGGGGVIVSEVYLDWTYVEQPVVAVNTPTGTYTDRNQVTAAWTPSLDSDGGAVTTYRVKVFDDATYGAGGFDPESSTPDYDSGDLSGAITSHGISESLANDTYRAYVKVAQTVNGEQLWSDWDFEEFTINVTAPAAPTVVATNDDANARNVITVTEGTPTQIADLFVVERSLDAGATWEAIRTVLGNGEALIAPTVVARSEAEDTANGTSHAIAYPTLEGGLKEDDLLIAIAAMDGNATMTWSAGWTEIADAAGAGSAVRLGAAYRRVAADGESGTLTMTTSGSQGGAIQILAIRGAHPTTAPDISSAATGSTANAADPPIINPGAWGTENTLWIPIMGIDSDEAVTAAPTGYYGFSFSQWASDADGAGVASAYRRERAASVDPGVFTHAAEDFRVTSLGIRPAHGNAGETYYDYEAPAGEVASYRARAVQRYVFGTDIASEWSASDDATWAIGAAAWWIKHPYQPELNMQVTILGRPEESRDSGAAVHKPLGREDPIVITDARILPSGTLVLESEDATMREDLDALLDTGDALLLQFPSAHDEPDKWVVFVAAHERARAADRSWVHIRIETLSWQEVAAPSGNLAEA